MADPGRLEQLERRLRELEEELGREKRGRGAARARIDTMSAEVTDSNPYRCAERLSGRRGAARVRRMGCREGRGVERWVWEAGEAHGAGGGSSGNLKGGAGCAQEGLGRCRRQVLRAEQRRDDLGFPTWLGWQGWMSGLFCIILLYNAGAGTEREREREETLGVFQLGC